MVRIGFKKTILPGEVGEGWWESIWQKNTINYKWSKEKMDHREMEEEKEQI